MLVSLGGWVSADLARMVIEALRPWAESAPADVVFVAGLAASAEDVDTLSHMLGTAGRVVVAPPDPAGLVAEADLAIVNGSVAAYEAAALGVPLIAMSVSANQDEAVAALGHEGAALSLGSAASVSSARILRAVESLAGDAGARTMLSVAARRLVDGEGARRLSLILQDLMHGGSGIVPPACVAGDPA